MVRIARSVLVLGLLASACGRSGRGSGSSGDAPATPPSLVDAGPPPARDPDAGDTGGPEAALAAAGDAAAEGGERTLAAWLRAHVPEGAEVQAAEGGGAKVVHTVAAGDTPDSVAKAYVEVTSIYDAKDLAQEITKRAGRTLAPGTKLEIPAVLTERPKDPLEGRLGWPEDKVLRGVFVTGPYAGIRWVDTLDKLAERGLNAVVLDGKDYQGPVNYPSKVSIAVETGAYVQPHVPDLARAIRFAHDRKIAVIMRIACFHDPWAAKHAPRLSLMGNWGGPFPMGWLDPTNEEAQKYITDLAEEEIAAGADEIQLDYVRFPVQAQSINSAVMPKPDGSRSRAMKAFVKRVRDITMAHHVPLSIDIFGVTATGDQSDIDKLGQDIGTVAGEADAISPMVYPSEYWPGYRGWDKPGNHPEIVGIGTKAATQKLKAAKNDHTVVRSWLQASSYKSTNYGPDYILKEAKSAEANGGTGWLLWSPGCDYWAAWRAFPVVK